MAGKRSVRLRSTYDVTRLLAKIINQVLRDEITSEKAGKVGYLANILLRGLEQSDLEARLKALEEKVAKLPSLKVVK